VKYEPARKGGGRGLDHGDARNDKWQTTQGMMSDNLGSQNPSTGGGTSYEQNKMKEFQDDMPLTQALVHMSRGELKQVYTMAARQMGPDGISPMIEAIRDKVQAKSKSAQDLRKALRLVDAQGAGAVDASGLSQALAGYGVQLSELQLVALLSAYDQNGTGHMQYGSFVDDVVAERTGTQHSRRRSSVSDPQVAPELRPQHQGGAMVMTINTGGRPRHVLNTGGGLGRGAVQQLATLSRNTSAPKPVPQGDFADVFSTVKHGRRAGSRGVSAGSDGGQSVGLSNTRSLYFDASKGTYSVQAM